MASWDLAKTKLSEPVKQAHGRGFAGRPTWDKAHGRGFAGRPTWDKATQYNSWVVGLSIHTILGWLSGSIRTHLARVVQYLRSRTKNCTRYQQMLKFTHPRADSRQQRRLVCKALVHIVSCFTYASPGGAYHLFIRNDMRVAVRPRRLHFV